MQQDIPLLPGQQLQHLVETRNRLLLQRHLRSPPLILSQALHPPLMNPPVTLPVTHRIQRRPVNRPVQVTRNHLHILKLHLRMPQLHQAVLHHILRLRPVLQDTRRITAQRRIEAVIQLLPRPLILAVHPRQKLPFVHAFQILSSISTKISIFFRKTKPPPRAGAKKHGKKTATCRTAGRRKQIKW